MRKIITIITVLVLATFVAGAQRYDRGYGSAPSYVKKGTWSIGGSAGYTQHINDDYQLAIVQGIDTKGYSVSFSPSFCYMIGENSGVGLKGTYKRGLFNILDAGMSVADITLSVKDYYNERENWNVAGFYKMFIPVDKGGRLSLFAEIQLGGGYGRVKVIDGHNPVTGIKGTWEEHSKIFLGVNPGASFFLTNHLAMEMSLGIFDVSYSWANQSHNQVWSGKRGITDASFCINPLAIGLGLYFYL